MKKMIIGVGIFIFLLVEILPAQDILWVSGNASRDQGFIDLLESQGYSVDRMADSKSMDTSKQALANTYDLVIIGRDLISGDYAGSDTEIALWNGITAPMINMTGYLLRSNRWRWVKSDSIKDTAYPVQAVMTNDPIFSGITFDEKQQVDFCTSPVTVAKVTDIGNGTLLGRRSANGAEYAWIVRWEPGVEYYPGSGQMAAGRRLAFIGGQAGGSPGDGAFNLTAAGTMMFLNAVYEMSGAAFDRPPVVVAGDDCISNLDQPLRLNGTVYDSEGIVDMAWSVQSGPGTVSFTSTEIADPYAIFSTEGTYILKLTASDAQQTVSDFITVFVKDSRKGTMLAHWDFENIPQSGELADVTGNGFTGIFYGTETPAMVAGNLTSGSLAVDLTGGEMYWEIPNAYDAAGLNFNDLLTGMTVTAWVRISDSSSHAPVIIGNGLDGWRFGINSGRYNFVFEDSKWDLRGPLCYDDFWHHFVGVFDGVGSQVLMYLDGAMVASLDVTPGTLINKGVDYPLIQIGNRGDGDRPFKGYIDDIKIYNYPMTAEAVADLALEGNLPVKVYAGDDQEVIYKGVAVPLDSSSVLSDDGTPAYATFKWSVVSVPASVTDPNDVVFSDDTIVNPTVTFPSKEGDYVLRLTADDTEYTNFDEVIITINIPTCGDVIEDGFVMAADISGLEEGIPDCHVDLYDLVAIAKGWLSCNDPADPTCESPYAQQE